MARVAKAFHFDSVEAALSRRYYAGGDVLDVGSHQGAYCFLFAGKARRGTSFFAFEPELTSYRILAHNLATLGGTYPDVRFVALPVPVGNGAPAAFTFPMGENFHPRVVSAPDGVSAPPTVRLDNFVTSLGLRPEFVKVDVEGAEVFVIEGMLEILRSHRPVLMLEVHPHFQPAPDSLETTYQRLSAAGYQKAESVECHVSRQEFWLPGK